jgi:uncharacterized membrane protein
LVRLSVIEPLGTKIEEASRMRTDAVSANPKGGSFLLDRTTNARGRSRRTVTGVLTGVVAGQMLGAATVAMGLIAGFFYAYACSVMVGLAQTDDQTFVRAMQWINATVRNAGFAPTFFGALLLSAAAAALHARRPASAVGRWALAAFVLYLVAFGITLGISVPLNEELAAAGAELAAGRERYERPWVTWNLVRTGFATLAFACLARALVLRGRLVPVRPG